MNASLYDEYVVFDAVGRKSDAKAALRKFIDAFRDDDEKERWARAFLDSDASKGKIRYEIFAEVLFPTLRRAYRSLDPWCYPHLVRTIQILYCAKDLWQQLDYTSEMAILRKWAAEEPSNSRARGLLVEKIVEWLAHCVHEWPTGILYGMNGANLAQCSEILAEIESVREMTSDTKRHAFLDDVETKVRGYMPKLLGNR